MDETSKTLEQIAQELDMLWRKFQEWEEKFEGITDDLESDELDALQAPLESLDDVVESFSADLDEVESGLHDMLSEEFDLSELSWEDWLSSDVMESSSSNWESSGAEFEDYISSDLRDSEDMSASSSDDEEMSLSEQEESSSDPFESSSEEDDDDDHDGFFKATEAQHALGDAVDLKDSNQGRKPYSF